MLDDVGVTAVKNNSIILASNINRCSIMSIYVYCNRRKRLASHLTNTVATKISMDEASSERWRDQTTHSLALPLYYQTFCAVFDRTFLAT